MKKFFKKINKSNLSITSTIIIVILFIITIIALATEFIMPNVVIKLIDAFVIACSVFATFLLIKFVYYQNIKILEKANLYQYNCMNTIFKNINITILLEDKTGRILTANKGQLDVIGLKPEDIIGKKTQDVFNLPKAYLKQKEEALLNKKIIKKEMNVEIRGKEKHWLRIGIFPVLDDNNEVDKVIVMFLNIDKEHQISELKDEFVATLTHDLKTPTLAQIKVLDLLLKNTFGPLTSEQVEILSHVKNSCKYLNDLVFAILDSYMYENGQKKLIYQSIEITELLNEALNETEYLAKEKNQNIVVVNNTINPRFLGDKLQLKRVLINLISNAINHGLVNTNICIKLSNDQNLFKFEIQNIATYIDENRLKEMFKKYKTNSKYKNIGTGLGLFLSKEIVEKHKGNIYAESFQDGLCIFCFEIPTMLDKQEQLLNNEIISKLQ